MRFTHVSATLLERYPTHLDQHSADHNVFLLLVDVWVIGAHVLNNSTN